MSIVEIHPEHIYGPWIDGFVLDRHVLSSRFIEYLGERPQFDTTRSPLGELIYQLKYRNCKPDSIVETAVTFITGKWINVFDCVVPPPPSLHRTKQPAVLIAEGIAAHFGVPVLPAATIKEMATEQMKNVSVDERAPMLLKAIQAGSESVKGRRVLLVDDLWETGSTLRRVAEVLGQMGASEIRALVMTRTR